MNFWENTETNVGGKMRRKSWKTREKMMERENEKLVSERKLVSNMNVLLERLEIW
jgi:hypothetical protein